MPRNKPPTYTLTLSLDGFFRDSKRNLSVCPEGLHEFFDLPDNVEEIDVVFLKKATAHSVEVSSFRCPCAITVDGFPEGLTERAYLLVLRQLRQGRRHVEIRY